jgi:hypothetical protein
MALGLVIAVSVVALCVRTFLDGRAGGVIHGPGEDDPDTVRVVYGEGDRDGD